MCGSGTGNCACKSRRHTDITLDMQKGCGLQAAISMSYLVGTASVQGPAGFMACMRKGARGMPSAASAAPGPIAASSAGSPAWGRGSASSSKGLGPMAEGLLKGGSLPGVGSLLGGTE